jgi:thioredoxin 1
MSVSEVDTHQFKEIIKSPSKYPYVFVDFYADWCGPCRSIAPKIDDLAKKHHHVTFLKVDIEESPELADFYNIQSLPTFMLLKRGHYKPVQPPVTGADYEGLKYLLRYSRHN